jgi:hypothetical protein
MLSREQTFNDVGPKRDDTFSAAPRPYKFLRSGLLTAGIINLTLLKDSGSPADDS